MTTTAVPAGGVDRAVRHHALWSERSGRLTSLALRDIFAASLRPGVISFAGGNPDIASLPLAGLAQTAAGIVAESGPQALQYSGGQGTVELRSLICELMALEGITGADADDVAVTVGSQSALDIVTKLFCNPGDVVLAEEFTYMGALGTFAAYEADVQAVKADQDGLVPDDLRRRITALKGAGKGIKFLYIIPNFNNPTGITLSGERRQRVVDICRDANVLVVEDNPYGLLRYGGASLPALKAANPLDVVYLSSFSKIFAPGLRMGWALIPEHLKNRFFLSGEAATLCPPAFNQMLVAAYLREHDWTGQLAVSRRLYRQRRDALMAALVEFLPAGIRWTVPDGGFFSWLTMPSGLDTQMLVPPAIGAGVTFIPGAVFSSSGNASARLRLAFSALTPELIAEGVRRLAPVLGQAMGQRVPAQSSHSPAAPAGPGPVQP
ncbi:MAG TPA: PLP-dependent aminotransferase family protein [Micrococcaceae bacterium]